MESCRRHARVLNLVQYVKFLSNHSKLTRVTKLERKMMLSVCQLYKEEQMHT
jgi:hypothetical protein